MSTVGDLPSQKYLAHVYLEGKECKRDYIRGYKLLDMTNDVMISRNGSFIVDRIVVAMQRFNLSGEQTESQIDNERSDETPT